jgi:tetratricopeptide (TPR) repeat protein
MFKTFRFTSAKTFVTMIVVAFAVGGCNQAASFYESGLRFLAQHDYIRAGLEFRNAVRLDRNLLAAWQRLAEVDELNENWGELVFVLRTIVTLSPNDNAVKLTLGRLLARAGSLDEALALANAALEANHRNADALALKALISLKRENSAAAITDARGALEIDPGNSDALLVLATDRFNHGDPHGALGYFGTNSDTHAKDVGIQLFKLMIFRQTNDSHNVESALQKLIEDYPEHTEFRNDLARLYISQQRNGDAESVLRAIVAMHPTDREAALSMERFLYATKGPAEARQELVRRIEAGGEAYPYQMALAELDLSQGNLESGVALLEKVIKTDGSPERVLAAQIKLAETYLSKNNNVAAEPLVSDILHKDSSDADGLRLRASIRSQRGQQKGAINDLRQAIDKQLQPTPLMEVLLGIAYERDGSMELAEQQLSEATRASSYNPRIAFYYVNFLRRRGNHDHADDALAETAVHWSANPEVLSDLLTAISKRQDLVGAQRRAPVPTDQEIFQQLLERGDYDANIGIRYSYGSTSSAAQPVLAQRDALVAAVINAYVQAHQSEKAIAFLKSALKTNPADFEAYILLGSLQLAAGAPEQALVSYKTAIQVQPNNEIGYRALAEYYMSQTRFDEAARVIREGLVKQPDNASLHVAMGGLLEDTEEYEAAIAEYRRALDSDPKSLVAANNLAYLLADRRTDAASLEKAVSLTAGLRVLPGSDFKDTLGWIAYRQGDNKGAIRLLEDAVAAFPNRAVMRFHLGMAYLADARSKMASEQFELALDQNPDDDLKGRIRAGLEKISGVLSAVSPRVQTGNRTTKD